LIEHDADLNIIDKNQRTPIFLLFNKDVGGAKDDPANITIILA